MSYLISAYFDKETTDELSHLIEIIAKESGNDFMIKNDVPPHLTLSAFELREENDARQAFRALNGKLLSGEIIAPSVGAFFPYVLYAQVLPSEYLNNLLSDAYMSITAKAGIRVSKYCLPAQWLPHITLGKTLEKDQMQKAFAILQDKFLPIRGKEDYFGLAKTNPHMDLEAFSAD